MRIEFWAGAMVVSVMLVNGISEVEAFRLVAAHEARHPGVVGHVFAGSKEVFPRVAANAA